MENDSIENIDNGFSSIYFEYENLSKENAIDISRRKTIRNHVNLFLQPNQHILEINAGSGIDAVYFAQNGHQVLATDIASGAENYINNKIKELNLHALSFLKTSFTNLQNIGKFDHIFSNFGGLNCTDHLTTVFNQFDDLLNSKGYITLVIMPPYYPWEMLTFLKGNKNAFRRLKKNGTLANIENHSVKTFYYTPKQVKNAMGKKFKHVKTQNIGVFYPSSHFASLQKFDKTVAYLLRFDNWINNLSFMIKGVGDYFIITFQKLN